MPHDLYIEFDYSLLDKSSTVLNTNIKESYIDDFLADVYHAQIASAPDHRKANERDIYNVLIRCDLFHDNINISSNTGNEGLTTGIIGDTIANWKFSDSPLEQIAKSEGFVGPPKPKMLSSERKDPLSQRSKRGEIYLRNI